LINGSIVNPVELSVVIPIRNEADALVELHREFTDTLAGWGRSYEIIFVDDGSTDASFEIVARLQTMDPRVRVIRFRRNFGQTAAFAAGFEHARGRLIATSDGDLQNDPRDLVTMMRTLQDSNLDIVCGWRRKRQDRFLSRLVPSMIANRLISWATGVRLHDYGCSLKLFRAVAAHWRPLTADIEMPGIQLPSLDRSLFRARQSRREIEIFPGLILA